MKSIHADSRTQDGHLAGCLSTCNRLYRLAGNLGQAFSCNQGFTLGFMGNLLGNPHHAAPHNHYTPDVIIYVEIREQGAYLHPDQIPGAGGLPVGTSGKALLLISAPHNHCKQFLWAAVPDLFLKLRKGHHS